MIMAWHGGGVFLIPIYPAKYLEQEREHYGGKVFTSANGCKVLWISARMLQNVVDPCKNVAKCCWSVLTCAKLKWGSWSRSLAGPWLAKHYLPYKICIFSCSTFSHYLFTDNLCLAPQIQAAFQRYILMLLCRFGFSMIEVKRPKLNHRNEKKRWIWLRHLKSIAVGVWAQGWPLLAEI